MDSDEEAAQTTADFVRNNKERRSRLDDVSFGDDGKTRDSAGAARAGDRRRAVDLDDAGGATGAAGGDRRCWRRSSSEQNCVEQRCRERMRPHRHKAGGRSSSARTHRADLASSSL